MSTNLRCLVWFILLALTAGVFCYQLSSNFSIQTNILKLLPKTEQDPFAEKSFQRFSDNNFKQIIIALESNDQQQTIDAAKILNQRLLDSGSIAQINSQITSDQKQSIAQLYFNHRFHLLTKNDRKLLQSKGSEPLFDASLQLIYSPLSGRLINLLPEDPFLLSYRYLQNQSALHPATHSNNGNGDQSDNNIQTQLIDDLLIYSHDNKYTAIISATLQQSPFDNQTQKAVTQVIEKFKQDFPQLSLLQTGALFYAQSAATSAKSEISTIGLGSLLGVILLLIIAFRSSVPLLLTLTSLASGIFLAFTVTHLYFGSIHVLTLVFGSSLVGVAVDYAFHYFASANQYSKPLKHIFNPILMGLISSVIGYIALFSTPFPGLQQMAVFCAAGLIGAFLTVVLLFDRIPYRVLSPQFLIHAFVKHQQFSRYLCRTPFFITLIAFPIIAMFLLLNTSDNNDNIRQLQSVPADLYQQEKAIMQLVQAPATNQFFVLRSDTPQQLLKSLQQNQSKLSAMIDQGAIRHYTDLSQFVPSRQKQRNNYHLIQQTLMTSGLQSFINQGLLSSSQIAQLQESFDNAQGNYLELSEWLESPLGQRYDYLWLGKIEDQYASIITLHGIQDIQALENLARTNNNLYFVNKVERVSSLFASYRILALYMLLIAVAIIFILLNFKYGITTSALVLLGPLTASALAIIVNILVNGSFNLFSTLALFLVFGIGIDYGLFYSESKTRSTYINLAIGLSAITTFLSFGLLSLSDTPAIHAFGLTMLTGILTVFLLSPILGHRIYQTKGIAND